MTTSSHIFAIKCITAPMVEVQNSQQDLPQAYLGCHSMQLFLRQITQNLRQHLYLMTASNLTNFEKKNIFTEKYNT